MLYITAIRVRWGEGITHIIRVRWSQPSVRKSGEASKMDVVRFIRDGGAVRVCDGIRELVVAVFDDHRPFLCTVADDRYTNNLLALPHF